MEGGEAVFCSMVREKALLWYGVEEPKDAMMMLAVRGSSLVVNWKGRSFWD